MFGKRENSPCFRRGREGMYVKPSVVEKGELAIRTHVGWCGGRSVGGFGRSGGKGREKRGRASNLHNCPGELKIPDVAPFPPFPSKVRAGEAGREERGLFELPRHP